MNSGDVYWIWVDIDGRGKSWRLAVCKWSEEGFDDEENDLMIHFVHDEHEDYAENYEECQRVRVDPPRGMPEDPRDG